MTQTKGQAVHSTPNPNIQSAVALSTVVIDSLTLSILFSFIVIVYFFLSPVLYQQPPSSLHCSIMRP